MRAVDSAPLGADAVDGLLVEAGAVRREPEQIEGGVLPFGQHAHLP
ncbi:hypothetical protein X759_34800 [Mesorhizobium sp. LSHC420B00]|nr:hypothetical protein X759_34800 [Mesorhizobium sp. LSHC420B00]